MFGSKPYSEPVTAKPHVYSTLLYQLTTNLTDAILHAQ